MTAGVTETVTLAGALSRLVIVKSVWMLSIEGNNSGGVEAPVGSGIARSKENA